MKIKKEQTRNTCYETPALITILESYLDSVHTNIDCDSLCRIYPNNMGKCTVMNLSFSIISDSFCVHFLNVYTTKSTLMSDIGLRFYTKQLNKPNRSSPRACEKTRKSALMKDKQNHLLVRNNWKAAC